jgi:Pan3 Pseudokinase domain
MCSQALGLLLLTLTCVGSGLRPSLDNCMANFSMDLTRIISALLASPEGEYMTAAAFVCLPALCISSTCGVKEACCSHMCSTTELPLLLRTTGGGIGSWRGLAAALGERLFMGLDSAQLYADALLGELGTEVTLLLWLETPILQPGHAWLPAAQAVRVTCWPWLHAQMDNGRLLRLCVRLSAVTERPEHEGDPQWSETGARLCRSLFPWNRHC